MDKTRNIYNNTLFNEIIRVDFLRIKNIQIILDNLQDLMEKNKYTFRTTDIRNVNINIEDPETLVTQEMIKSNINTTKNYEYVSFDESQKFVLNEYFLIFEKNNFDKYSKIDKYLDIMKLILEVIISNEPDIKISRVGIRKMNQLFLGDLETLKKYINYNIPQNDVKILDEYATIQKNVDNDGGYSSNIMINLKKGRGSINNSEEIQMYRFVWDIDCYNRKIANTKIIDGIKNLNEYLFERYASIITDDFYTILADKDYDLEKLQTLKIYGGVNKNE